MIICLPFSNNKVCGHHVVNLKSQIIVIPTRFGISVTPDLALPTLLQACLFFLFGSIRCKGSGDLHILHLCKLQVELQHQLDHSISLIGIFGA